ncbi:hypothetical protein QVD17_02902 [Tagetes erecta]|uniref:Uncharacterized protein n=1 Tax=Tagetes erecta TaxID=13708 RepID=A0AAD8P9F7_TARER|nr:hypothetical protein QVD17_02902 [Tagetes erecta]
MDQINQDPSEINRNKRKFQGEILDINVAAKHTCFCLERSSTQSSIQLDMTRNNDGFSEDVIMSASDDDSRNHVQHPHSTPSSSSSVNWIGTNTCFDTKICEDDISFEDCEFSSSECITKQSIEDLFCSNSNNSVLSSGRWNVNQDSEQGTEKLTIDKEFEQYFSMLML